MVKNWVERYEKDPKPGTVELLKMLFEVIWCISVTQCACLVILFSFIIIIFLIWGDCNGRREVLHSTMLESDNFTSEFYDHVGMRSEV